MQNPKDINEHLFSKNGIRGVAGRYPLTSGMIVKIGSGIARLILKQPKSSRAAKVIIARDVTSTTQRIELMLADALNFCGIDVFFVGAVPSPALAYLVRYLDADMGMLICAGSGRFTDSGIKFFSRGGLHLSAGQQESIEEVVFGNLMHDSQDLFPQTKGKSFHYKEGLIDYLNFLKAKAKGLNLEGLNLVLACREGTISAIAKTLFEEFGAGVNMVSSELIKELTEQGLGQGLLVLGREVLAKRADLGIFFSREADKLLVIDEAGNILDGDYLMIIISLYLLEKKALAKNQVVATLDSNYGLKLSLERYGAELIYCRQGERPLFEKLTDEGLNLGGENTGRILFLDHSPVSDALLTGLKLLEILRSKGKALSELAKLMQKLPRFSREVRVRNKKAFASIEPIRKAIAAAAETLKDNGRLLLRYSKTKPLARIVVEAKDEALMQQVGSYLSGIVKQELGVLESNN